MRTFSACLLVLCLVACGRGGDAPAADSKADLPVVANNDQVESRGAGKDNWWNALPRSEWALFEKVETGQYWFEVYLVEEGVYAIYEPGQFEEVISFLVLGSERALLFDTGLGIGDIGAIVSRLTELDVSVLNSHGHYDHIGGNHQFDEILATDSAFSRQRAEGSDVEAVADFLSPGWVWKPLPDGFDAETFRSRPYSITSIVGDGSTIDLGGRVLEVLATPGHAPDAICLLDRDNRLLFVGDTFYLAPLYTHLDGSDFDQYAQSAARLAQLAERVDSVMTAHNVPVVASRFLVELDAAFTAIREGGREYVLTDGFREYDFGEFSVIVRDAD